MRVAPLSSQFDLFDNRADLEIQDSNAIEFGATGLKRRCYVIGGEVVIVRNSALLQELGSVTGFLDQRFRDWYGI